MRLAAAGAERRLRGGSAATAVTIAGLLCILVVPVARGLTCYRCTILPPQYEGEPNQPCSKFDGSSRFYQDCPTSTFCMKRIINYRLSNGSMVMAAERNCASQRYFSQEYNYLENKWHQIESIDTKAYKEGCFQEENRGTPNEPSEYCYCPDDYCNKSPPMANSLHYCSLLVITVLLVLRFSL